MHLKLIMYPILQWLFENLPELKKRACLARYLLKIEIPPDQLADQELYELLESVRKITIDNVHDCLLQFYFLILRRFIQTSTNRYVPTICFPCEALALFTLGTVVSIPPSLPSTIFVKVTGAWFPPLPWGAYDWVARIRQPREWSPSGSWLPIASQQNNIFCKSVMRQAGDKV